MFEGDGAAIDALLGDSMSGCLIARRHCCEEIANGLLQSGWPEQNFEFGESLLVAAAAEESVVVRFLYDERTVECVCVGLESYIGPLVEELQIRVRESGQV